MVMVHGYSILSDFLPFPFLLLPSPSSSFLVGSVACFACLIVGETLKRARGSRNALVGRINAVVVAATAAVVASGTVCNCMHISNRREEQIS